MRAVTAGTKRETLLQEINSAFLEWPELERRVFSQAHYHGQSPEAISRSLQVDLEAVNIILKRCEQRLYASLRNFRKNDREKASLIPDGLACLPACKKELQFRSQGLAVDFVPRLRRSVVDLI